MIRGLLCSVASRRMAQHAAKAARNRFVGSSLAIAGGYGSYEMYNRFFRKLKRVGGVNSENEPNHLVQARKQANHKLKLTFKELTAGLLATGAGAAIGYRYRFQGFRNKWMYLIGSFGLLCGTLMTDERENPNLKKYLYYGFSGFTGLSLCAFHPEILLRASLYTGAVAGGLTAGAYFSREWKSVEGYLSTPLFVGLNVMFVSSIINFFWRNPNSAFMKANFGFWLYGGLALFSLYLYYDMHVLFKSYYQKEFALAETYKNEYVAEPEKFDKQRVSHVNDALGVYLDIINILIRIVVILSDSN